MSRTKIKDILGNEAVDYRATVKGWVRHFRNNQFIALTDGSGPELLQVVVSLDMDEELRRRITAGAAISAEGTIVASLGKGQRVELKADTVEILGDCDTEQYPLQLKNRPSLEFLREHAHLRFRTATFSAIFRIRHTLAYAVHRFFHERGFVYLHTPIITASDAEGAGEMFRVSTLDPINTPYASSKFARTAEFYYNQLLAHADRNGLRAQLDALDETLKQSSERLSFRHLVMAPFPELTRLATGKADGLRSISAPVKDLYDAFVRTGYFPTLEDRNMVCVPENVINEINPTRNPISATNKHYKSGFLSFSFYNFNFIINHLRNASDRQVDWKEDFFERPTNLTVSGQLEAELGAMALGEVYTFGPTFRAENSNTARHLAEFWMIEPEVAFADLNDDANLAEAFIQYVIKVALEERRDDLEFLAQRLIEEEKSKPQNERSESGLLEKLEGVIAQPFERITYTEAIKILLESPAYKKKKFKFDVAWGSDLQSEHERYLVEKHFKKPVIVTDYPAAIKSFYMRMNDGCEPGRETVAAMDILAPGIGEIVGGSQREERLDKLMQRMADMHIPQEELYWYLDIRRFGSAPHAGFGLGFERLVQFVTGMANIRDVIPFPRTPGSAAF
jgi:aspartyl/asparaginyl-tRNA synthetase